jgi:peptidoglycan/LPS O-acetylase OafA/YrhL
MFGVAAVITWLVAWFSTRTIVRWRSVWWIAVIGAVIGWVLAILSGFAVGLAEMQYLAEGRAQTFGIGIWTGVIAAVWSAIATIRNRSRSKLTHFHTDRTDKSI